MIRVASVAAALTVLLFAGAATAITDRSLTERGQMLPYADTAHPASHANAMRQGRYAAAGGPADRVVVAFAEGLVKTLPLLPGASVRGAPGVLPSGNLIMGSGRGIGYSSLSLHDPVTGEVIWAAPAYLGPSDYVNARTVGPGAYLQPQPLVLSDGNIYLTDGYNLFSLEAETGVRNWFTPQSGLPAGPQRERGETSRPQSLEGDMSVSLSVAPEGVRSPTGGWLIGGVYSRGSINYFDTTDGQPLIVKSAESENRSPSCLAADAANNAIACSSFGYDSPLLFAVLGFICFPGGEISTEMKDWCQGLGFTRYFSVNETMVDPLRNRIAFTYAGTGGTVETGANTGLFRDDFDLFKVWEFVTSNGAGQDGTILTADTDADGFGDAGLEEVWLAEIGLNSRASPTLSESFELLYGVDGWGTGVAFDAGSAAAQVLASSSVASSRVWPSMDHNDSLVICSSETGLARVSPRTGDVIWQNHGTNLGLDRLPVLPSVPLFANGRPAEDCVGSPSTHIDVYQAQFAVGYPVVLMDSLRSLGLPIASPLAAMGTVDFQVDPRTGEKVDAKLRSFYRGSGEANVASLDSGRFVSARTDRVAAVGSGFLNMVLPRRFDVPPVEGGFVIAEPVSFRDAVLSQFHGAQRYCEEVLQGVFVPDEDGDGVPEQISEALPIVVAGFPAQEAEQNRKLQLAVNKLGYINSIMKSSVPGRLSNALGRAEIDSLEASAIQSSVDGIVSSITTARDLLLGDAVDRKDPATSPDEATQTQARAQVQIACDLVEQALAVVDQDWCASASDCDDGNDCTVESCVGVPGLAQSVCRSQNGPAGASCASGGGTCDGAGVCVGSIASVWANDGGDKVARAESRASVDPNAVLNSVWDGSEISIFGARNEVVSFNLVLEAFEELGVEDVSVSFDTLTGSAGVIGSTATSGDGVFDWVGRNIELFYVRYLQIAGLSRISYDSYDERHVPERLRRPYTGEGFGTGVWADRPDHDAFYPDIAVPLELVGEFDIGAGQNQSVWVDVYIPKSAIAGDYLGTITIRERGQLARQVPVRLTVRDFTLPDVPTAKTMLYLGYSDVNDRYTGIRFPNPGTLAEATSRLVRDRHFQLAHRHRISVIDENHGANAIDRPSDQWLPRLDGSLFTASNGYDGPGVGVGNDIFSIGTYGRWSWLGEGEASMRQHTDAWAQWFAANAPSTEYFLYLVDEPPASLLPQVEQWAQWINDNPGPGSAVRSMATVSPIVAPASTPSLDIPTGWGRIGSTNVWQAAADQLLADPDKRLYMYNGFRPGAGSFATEDDGVALRELAWGQYKKSVDRWFYWESTYYRNFQGGAGDTNVFQRAQTYGAIAGVDPVRGETGWNYSNGDGVLFYPGTDMVYPQESYGVLGPFASLRLKHWRRGIQDVDYLAMAAAIDPVRVDVIVDSMVPKVLWEYGVAVESDPTWVRADLSWSTDPDVWEAVRSELADIIELGN